VYCGIAMLHNHEKNVASVHCNVASWQHFFAYYEAIIYWTVDNKIIIKIGANRFDFVLYGYAFYCREALGFAKSPGL